MGSLSCPQLQQYAQGRDEAAVTRFWQKVRRMRIRGNMILAVDETSKDGRAMRRSFGYAVRGRDFTPIGSSGLLPRGERISSLCSFDVNGFVAWKHEKGTYNRDRFLTASQDVVVRSSSL